MTFTLTFKTPDVLNFLEQRWGKPEEMNDETYEKYMKAKTLVEKYVEYGEYVYLEFDTVTMSVKVLPQKR